MPDLILRKVKRITTGLNTMVCFDLPKHARVEAGALILAGIEKSDDCYDVKISLPKKIRTTGEYSQNHHLNGDIQQISEATWNDFSDVKLYVKRRAFKLGLPFMTKPNGDIVYSLIDGEPLPISEKDMTTIQCGWCIDCAHEVAAEMGIVLVEE